MEERLKELYRGVAVHATADREHMAALELLALVMLADSHLGDDELDVLRELTEDWRGKAFSFEQYLGPAMAKARRMTPAIAPGAPTSRSGPRPARSSWRSGARRCPPSRSRR